MKDKAIQTVFEVAALITIAVFILLLLNELRRLTPDVRTDVNDLTSEIRQTIVTVNAAADQARQASAQANLAAAEQRAYWAKTSLETYKTMASLRLTIVRTDKSLNDELVPRLAKTLDSTAELSTTAAADLHRTMEELQPTLGNLSQASSAAAAAMSDPAIHDTLVHLDGVAAESEKTAAHLEATTHDVQTFIHRETEPVRGTWNLFKELLSLTFQARGAIGY